MNQAMAQNLRQQVPQAFRRRRPDYERGLAANTVDRATMYEVLAANDLLRRDQAREMEETLTRVARRDLVGVADLRSAGLSTTMAAGIGATVYQFDNVGAMSDARQHMSVSDLGDEDQVDYANNFVPIPVTSKPFRLDQRQIAAGQQGGGEDIDTTNVGEATRRVIDKLEETLVNGGDVNLTVDGNQVGIPGYTTLSARDTVTLSTVWDTLQSNGNLDNAVEDVLTMRSNLRDNGFGGPYTLYIPSNYDGLIDDDYKAETDRTLRERLVAMNGINQVKVLPALADDNVLLVQMTESVVQMPVGQDITTVTWDLNGGLASKWVVMGVLSFALKIARDESDNNVAGISHLS